MPSLGCEYTSYSPLIDFTRVCMFEKPMPFLSNICSYTADDSRLSDGGFVFTLGAQDVDTKVTFRCNLIID